MASSQNGFDPLLPMALHSSAQDREALERKKRKSLEDSKGWVADATRNTFTWVTEHTKLITSTIFRNGEPCLEEPFSKEDEYAYMCSSRTG